MNYARSNCSDPAFSLHLFSILQIYCGRKVCGCIGETAHSAGAACHHLPCQHAFPNQIWRCVSLKLCQMWQETSSCSSQFWQVRQSGCVAVELRGRLSVTSLSLWSLFFKHQCSQSYRCGSWSAFIFYFSGNFDDKWVDQCSMQWCSSTGITGHTFCFRFGCQITILILFNRREV